MNPQPSMVLYFPAKESPTYPPPPPDDLPRTYMNPQPSMVLYFPAKESPTYPPMTGMMYTVPKKGKRKIYKTILSLKMTDFMKKGDKTLD